jgi:hypothetical protein
MGAIAQIAIEHLSEADARALVLAHEDVREIILGGEPAPPTLPLVRRAFRRRDDTIPVFGVQR